MRKSYFIGICFSALMALGLLGCVSQQELERVEQERERLQSELSSSRERIGEKQNRIASIEKELEQNESARQELVQQLEDARDKIVAAERNLEDARRGREHCQEELAAANQRISELEEGLRATNERNNELEKELREADERVSELESELEAATVQISELQNKLAVIRTEGTETTPVETEEPAQVYEEGIGHLNVQAVYSSEGATAEGVRYTVQTKEGETLKGPARQSSFELESGDYIIVAEVGAVEKAVEVGVQAEKRKEREIVLDAGILGVSALLAEDGPEAAGAVIEVLSVEKNIHGEHEKITGPHGRRTSFILPAATYLVRVRSGQAEAEKEVVVQVGERVDYSVVMHAGKLHARVKEADGTPLSEDIRWSVFAMREDTQDEEGVIEFSRNNQFVLPQGQYVLQGHVGERQFRKEFEIKSGEEIQVEIESAER